MPEIKRRRGYNGRYCPRQRPREGMDNLVQLLPFIYIGIIIVIANQAEAGARGALLLRVLLYTLVLLPPVYVLLTFAGSAPMFQLGAGGLAFGVTLLFSGMSAALLWSSHLRIRLYGVFGSAYRPESPVHLTALVLMLAASAFTLSNFVLSGGISGLAESLQTEDNAVINLLLSQLIWIVTAFAGVGWLTRRSLSQSADRLGLRFPLPEDFNWGLGFGLLTYVIVIGFIAVWALVTAPELFAEQTAASRQMSSIFESLPQAFALSLLIGFGEEVLFRGALQPVFGIGFTSVFFTVLHTQYTLTPATLALFGVALMFGWLRKRYSTTAAVIAHFVYNFVQLALGILVSTP